jgi:hypothetical protein
MATDRRPRRTFGLNGLPAGGEGIRTDGSMANL